MSLITDTSVIIAILTNEAHKSELIKLTRGKDLIAPESLHYEIGNAFSAMIKRKRINLKLAERALEQYKKIPLRLVSIDLSEAVSIAGKYGIYAYDAYFVECAIRYKSELISLDRTLIEIASKEGIKTIKV